MTIEIEVLEDDTVVVEFDADWADGKIRFDGTEWGRAEEFINTLVSTLFERG